ncbi:MAG: BtrH N-terminal domain-containing protein [Rubripirellula sp.]
MKLKSFDGFAGHHCETTATGCLLRHIGVELSEPMLFGLGQGLGYIYWNMKSMDFPFIGGRVKPDVLTQNLCRNLNLELDVQQTSSAKKAWQNVVAPINAGMPVGLKLDCFHLDYFKTKVHFAGHYVAMHGYDDTFAYLVDTGQQGGQVKTSIESLACARSEKGPMASKNLSYTISRREEMPKASEVVRHAIHQNATDYLNPPITNLTYKGILKTSREIKKWFRTSKDVKRDFQTTAMLMEHAGTGGALFRNIYRDFLVEAHELTSVPELNSASSAFAEIATLWTQVSVLFNDAGTTSDITPIDAASDLLVDLSSREKEAMEILLRATAA